MKLSTKIYGAFGVILALLTVLAVLSFVGLQSVQGLFTDYRSTARKSLLANELTEVFAEARLRVMQYRIADSDERAAQVHETIEHLMAAKEAQGNLFTSEEDRSQLASLTEQAASYLHSFDEMTALQARRNELVPVFHNIGRDVRANITSIRESAYGDGDVAAANAAGAAQESLMLGRFYAERFLLTNAQDAFERAIVEFQTAEARVSNMVAELQNFERRRIATSVLAGVNEAQAGLTEIADVIAARNDVRAGRLDVIGPNVLAGYAEIMQAAVDRQNAIGPQASKEIADITTMTVAIAVLCMVLGVVAAFFVGRLITRGINRTVGEMTQVAEGNLDIEISGTSGKDELGDMARALEVFHANALENRRLEAEQAAASERLEAEKRRAMAELADGFEASVDQVVGAVSSAADQLVSLSQSLSAAAGRA
ncbi:MAG: HAMP domain-containing protein, partial [Pseudomonadota bacterium]